MVKEGMKNIYICFPEGKHKVLTMIFDDGRLEDRRLVDIFNRYGIKGTFHVNSAIKDEKRVPVSEYRELYKGHEVSCHTCTHPTIARCPMEQVVSQILEDRRNLEAAVGYPVRGLSYPNGSYNEEIVKILPALGIRYSRTVEETNGFAMPEDFLKWKATCHYNHNLIKLGDEFAALHKTQYLYMMYVWGHSYEFTDHDNWEVMENFCQRMGGREDIWYASNIEIVDYMEAAGRLQFGAGGDMVYNPSAASLWIEVDGGKREVKGGELLRL